MSLTTIAKKVGTLLLFDQSSQQILADIADSSKKDSKEFNIVTLSQASLGFYNALENNVTNIPAVIKATKKFLKKLNKKLLEPINLVLYYKLMADIEIQNSLYKFKREETKHSQNLWKNLYSENDENAKKIEGYILKQVPENLKRSIPSEWVTDWIVLFPPFYNHIINFYQPHATKDQKNRKIKDILLALRSEANIHLGIGLFKQYIAHQKIDLQMSGVIRGLVQLRPKVLQSKIKSSMLQELKDIEDIKPPKRVSMDGIVEAIKDVEKNVEEEKNKRDPTKYTTALLHLGILYYLSRNYENAIKTLLKVLVETKKIAANDKKEKVNCHETFPDIPFMIGSSYLKLCLKFLKNKSAGENFDVNEYLLKAKKAFSRALHLSSHYHQAFLNKIIVEYLIKDGSPLKEFQVYKHEFDGSLMKLDKHVFQIMAHFEKDSESIYTPKMVFNLMLYLMNSTKETEVNEAEEMLADLKTLYVLNSYDIAVSYYRKFKVLTRNNTSGFIDGLKDSKLHSAMLFYFAHAFCSLSILNGKNGLELDYENINEAIELNTNSLFFYENNPSSLRLLDTITQIIQFVFKDVQFRWENKAHSLNGKMNVYETYLNIQKVKENYKQKLKSIGLDDKLPDFLDVSADLKKDMETALTDDQKEKVVRRLAL